MLGVKLDKVDREDEYNRLILQAVASGEPVTQRSLSRNLGVALGLTNLLIRRLVAKGYVQISRMGTRHVRYLMTTEGWEALTRTTRASLENTIHLYTETREQIHGSLALVSHRCAVDPEGHKRIVFYGAGDAAEIAYVSLQRTDLRLAAVVDDRKRGVFFGIPIESPDMLTDERRGAPYLHVVVTSIRHANAILAKLDARSIGRSRISCL